MSEGKTKRWDCEAIQALLRRSASARLRALLLLANAQTPDERRANASFEHNGRGFTKYDAPLLTAIAQRASASGITPGQDLVLAKRLPKYWAQLLPAIAERQRQGAPIKQTKSYVEIAA